MVRPRVSALIELAAGSALGIVRGPRNGGKSVAVSHWSSNTARKLLWLHLTERTTTRQQFWLKLHASLIAHVGIAAAPLDAPRFQQDPAHYLAALLSEARPFTLVLEDFHRVRSAGVERELLAFLSYAPGMSVLILTRSALDVESNQISSNVDVCVVEPAQLQFSDEEAARYYAGSGLGAVANELNERLSGSPTLHRSARRMALVPHKGSLSLTDEIVRRVTRALRRDLTSASNPWRSSSVEAFVAATLPLQHFDVELACIVTENPAAEDVILELAEEGLLRSTETPAGPVHSYPPIAADIYAELLADDIADRRHSVLTSAIDLELSRGANILAFRYAVDTANYRLASRLLVRSGMRLLLEDMRGLSEVLRSIPYTQIAKHPLLAFGLGLIYNADKRTRFKGLEYFMLATASAKVQAKSLPSEEKLAVDLVQAVALRVTGQFKLSASLSRKCLKTLAELALADREQLETFEAVALGHWGISLLAVGDEKAANKALHLSLATGQHFDSRPARFFAASLLAYHFAVQGELHKAVDYVQTAQTLFPDDPFKELYQHTPLNMALALIALGRLDPDTAEAHLGKVISETATSEFWGRLRVLEARIELLRGRAGIASGRLQAVLATINELPALNPVDSTALAVVSTELMLANGKASQAARAIAKIKPKSPAGTVAQARLKLATGRPAEVVELVAGTEQFGTAEAFLEASILLTVARLHLQPAASVRSDIAKISGTMDVLQNLWPLAMLSASDLQLLLNAADELNIPLPDVSGLPTALVPNSLSVITLTPREASILAVLATTGDRDEIARLQFVSVNTVKTQLRSLYKKLGVGSREEALLVAHQENLFHSHQQDSAH